MSLKENFLEAFTKELILNSAPVYVLNQLEEDKRKEFTQQINLNLEPSFKIETEDFDPLPENEIPQQTIQPESSEDYEEIPQAGVIESNGMEKIAPLLDDELVTNIECFGPEKFISIDKGHRTITTRTSLDKNEIESILNQFSKEARIPRIGGVFKAIINNLIINAIDSDFGGPRFIITKIHPQESEYLED
tara:strand:- start:1833 stop:2405 length:573 start_codon:yes stop_codon:yes gene_type:complete